MAIKRTVETDVYCDVCGEWIIGWRSNNQGTSKLWAAYFARKKGCTVGEKVICKKVQDQEADPDMQHTAKNRKCRKGQRWKLHGIRKRNIRRATGEVQTVHCVHILPVERIVQRIEAETVSNDRPPETTSRC